MGGQAFASGANPLYTPRMSPAVYQFVKSWCHGQLQKLFVCVDTPIEGPGKSDFGDIDVFMAGLRSPPADDGDSAGLVPAGSSVKDYLAAAAKLLKAERAIYEKEGCGMFAVPWPSDAPEVDPTAPAEQHHDPAASGAEDAVTDQKKRFIQVDVHICTSVEELEWHVFKHAHGDVWNLLGSTIRPFGLTVDEVGMWLRVPEIEQLNRNKAKILLTRDPTATLAFLGLSSDHGEWTRQFASVDDAFKYATTCRLFWVRPEVTETSSTAAAGTEAASALDGSDADGEAGHGGQAETGGEFERGKLKANDRRRMAQRPMYRKWIDEYLPKLREEGRFGSQRLTRDDVREEAFATFAGVRGEYEARLRDWQRQRQKETLWKDVIKGSLPEDLEGMYRGCLASALKKIVMEGDESLGVRPDKPLTDEHGLYVVDNVREFVTQNWEEVGRLAWQRNHERYLQSKVFKSKGKKNQGGPDNAQGD